MEMPKAINKDVIKYDITEAAINKMVDLYMPLTISGIDDKAGYEEVKGALSVVRGKRVEVEKTRKNLKKDALDFGRKVDSAAKGITAKLTPIEAHLKNEKTAIDEEKARITAEKARKEQERIQGRINELLKYGAVYVGGQYGYGGITVTANEIQLHTDEEWNSIVSEVKNHYEAEQKRIADAKKAEEERKAKEEADRKAERERLDEQRQAQGKIAKAQAARGAEIKAAQDKIDADNRNIEYQYKLKQIEKDAKGKAGRAEAMKPDEDRLLAFAKHLGSIEIPEETEFESDKAKAIIRASVTGIAAVVRMVEKECEHL